MVIIVQLGYPGVFYFAFELIDASFVQSSDWNLRGWYNLFAKLCHAWITLLILYCRVKEDAVDLFGHFLLLCPFQICLNFNCGHS